MSARKSKWVMLDVAWVDVSEECETDVFTDVEFVDEVVPDFGLVFFAD